MRSGLLALVCPIWVAAYLLMAASVTAAPPANDNFSAPTILTGFPITATGTNTSATIETDEPLTDFYAGHSVWFRWTAPTSTSIQIDTFGSSFDTVLAVWTGATLTGLTWIADNDQYGGDQSAVFFDAVSGKTYRIAVYGWDGAVGTIKLHITNDFTSRIAGTVTGPNGVTPLAGIDVTAYKYEQEFSYWNNFAGATTDENGRYQIIGLATGVYRVGFADYYSGDYIAEYYNNKPTVDSGNNIQVPFHTVVSNINASLAAASKISGRVTDATGTIPLADVEVVARTFNGFSWDYGNGDYTDDNGLYVIGGLVSNTYRVTFTDWSGTYAAESYSNAPFVDVGTDIVVPATTVVENIDAMLEPAAGIQGTVTDPGGLPLADISAAAHWWSGSEWIYVGDAVTDADGAYAIGRLAAASYRVTFDDYFVGLYASESYDNAVYIDSGVDINVPLGLVVSNINARLSLLTAPEPAALVGLRQVGPGTFDVLFTGMPGAEYILKEASDVTNGWNDVGFSVFATNGVNSLPGISPLSHGFWQVGRMP